MKPMALLIPIMLAGCAAPHVDVTMYQPDAVSRSTIVSMPCDEFTKAHRQVWRDVHDMKYKADAQHDDYAYWFWNQVQRAMSSGLIKDTHECLKEIPVSRKYQ